MLQESLIFPGHAEQGSPETRVLPAHDTTLTYVTTSTGDRIYLEYGRALGRDGTGELPDAQTRPTLIFFYGNAMSLSSAVDFCRQWRTLGANTLGVEYPGYGMSSGKPGEAAFYSAADAAYDYLAGRGDVDMHKVIPTGLSLGTGVAVDLASRRRAAGLILLAPYTSMDEMARIAVPWLPTALILKHHFRSDSKIGKLQVPILIVHGTEDEVIPCELSARLAKAATAATVRRITVSAGHNDLFDAAGPQIDAEMSRLIDQVHQQP